MTTTKSYSKNRFAHIFKHAVKTQMPLGIVTAIFCVLFYPVIMLYNIINTQNFRFYEQFEIIPSIKQQLSEGVYWEFEMSGIAIFVLAVIMMTSALIANGYLHSKKKVDMYHSLPVLRPQYLTANFLASFLVISVPFILSYVATMLIQVVAYSKFKVIEASYFQLCFADMASILIFMAVVYLFTTVISVHVSTTFDALAITGTVGFMPLLVVYVSQLMWQVQTYGANFRLEAPLTISPFLYLFDRYEHYTYAQGMQTRDIGKMLAPSLVWLLIAVLLYGLAIVLYNRRKSEIAGQVQPKGILQRVVIAFASFGGAMLFFAIFYDQMLFIKLIAMLVGGILIGTVGVIIFSRGARKLKEHLVVTLAGGGAACLVLVIVLVDPTGYVTRVPTADQVESVSISYRGRFEDVSSNGSMKFSSSYYDDYYDYYGSQRGPTSNRRLLTNPESIAVVLDMHNTAISNTPKETRRMYYYDETEDFGYYGITLNYTLKNGKKIARHYSSMNTESFKKLVDLEDKDDFIANSHDIFLAGLVEGTTISNFIKSISLNDVYGTKSEIPEYLTSEQLEKLITALHNDMLSETLENIKNPTKPAVGYLKINFKSYEELEKQQSTSPRAYYDYGSSAYGYNDNSSVVLLTDEYKQTLAVLRELNLTAAFEMPKIETLYVVSAYDVGEYVNNRVNIAALQPYTAVSEAVRSYQRDTLEETYGYAARVPTVIATSDPTEIKQIDAAAKSQLYLENTDQDYAIVALATKENSSSSYKYVLISALPQKMREELKAQEDLRRWGRGGEEDWMDYERGIEMTYESVSDAS